MRSLGYGPDNRLAVKIAARNIPDYGDAATILSDQLKQIWIDTELDLDETANWLPKLVRRDFVLAQACSAAHSTTGPELLRELQLYLEPQVSRNTAIPEVEKLLERQSAETDQEQRRKLVWEMNRRLQEAVMRPIL